MTEAKSANRVMDILNLLSGLPGGMTLSAISESLVLPKSSAHEILHAMVEKNYLQWDCKRYRVGFKVFEIGQTVSRNLDLLQAVRPHLKSTSEKLSAVTQFGVLDKTEVVYLSKMQPHEGIALESRVGSRLPAHVTAIGKAMLSVLPEEEVLERYSGKEFHHFTRNSIGSIEELLSNLRGARASSYAEDMEEYTEGVFCLSVPIPNDGERATYAISVSMSRESWNKVEHDNIVRILETTAKTISESMSQRLNSKVHPLKVS
ncbi:MAG: IclR family transcriptional regulator [Actinobacteria bacterium]|nr:IclR family transcriptional regulator [Actinomycetota bacterium]